MTTPGLNVALRDIVRVRRTDGTFDIGRVSSIWEPVDGTPVRAYVDCLNGGWIGNARDVLTVRTDEANRWFVTGLAFSKSPENNA